MTHIRKAVFPVAGMGTRFLPATKSIPKEMLPIVDRPLIQYAVDEAREAGIEEFIFVSAAGKGALEDYFDTAAALEMRLKAAGKDKALDALLPTRMPEGALTILRQAKPKGLGHAVRQAKRHIGDEPFAVLLPDDLIKGKPGALAQMVAVYAKVGGHMVATMDVPLQATSAYGVLDVVFEHGPGAGGEMQLTDAINADARSVGVCGYRFAGERFDCGAIQGVVQATAAFALERPELAGDFSDFLSREITAQAEAA